MRQSTTDGAVQTFCTSARLGIPQGSSYTHKHTNTQTTTRCSTQLSHASVMYCCSVYAPCGSKISMLAAIDIQTSSCRPGKPFGADSLLSAWHLGALNTCLVAAMRANVQQSPNLKWTSTGKSGSLTLLVSPEILKCWAAK